MDLFNKTYNRKDYLNFLEEKFRFSRNLTPVKIGNQEDEKFSKLGFITTSDDKKLPIFEVHINPNTLLARNRVQLRNLVAEEIEATEDGALAVYVDDDNKKWRFSFIAIEYKLIDGGTERKQTASKRFTYLLGESTQTRTAQDRFSRIGKQSTLGELKDAFAVEPLSKEFYDRLYKWYERAQEKVAFPNDEKAENHIETSLIRLLTRLLFVWFLKEKQLINKDLFELAKLKDLIHYEKDSSFYKAILQNLFFATLSTSIEDRGFCNNKTRRKGWNSDFGNQYSFRYREIFKKPDAIKSYFNETPFLNGGLFDCLDDKESRKYIDGFTRTKKHQPVAPNELFFNTEQNLGLIDLFHQYQFTVEESTPLDVEVALDPELLGKVFENLLATYNPETGDQARKATGSFYTPREIVAYMVDESLKQHFKTHTKLTDEQINALFAEKQNTTLGDDQIKTVIQAIDSLKILDPAVGSGAYPMGILQRLVFILEKIDPQNSHFKQQQLDQTELMDDQASKKASRQAIEQVFSSDNQHNSYGKKLTLIEKVIYGVDIQPIAIQICKLRFFISLTIEQKPNLSKDDNYGIRALPNLETKFIVTNSLLPLAIESSVGQSDIFTNDLQQKLLKVRHDYFSAKAPKDKREYRAEDKRLRQQMLERITQSGMALAVKANMQKIVDWDLYNQNAIADWFDPEWQFGVKNGFDIVLGNPPYIRHEKIKEFKSRFKQEYQVFAGTADIYTYFYERGFKLLSERGHLCYITSNKWMRAGYGKKLRSFFKETTHLKQIIDFEGEQIFANATVDTNILLCGKKDEDSFHYAKQLPNEKNSLLTMPIADLSDEAYVLQAPKILALRKKIEKLGRPLKEWDINIYRGILTGFNKAFLIDTAKKDELIAADPKSTEIIKPILRGKDIRGHEHRWAELWLIATFPALKLDIDNYPAVKKYLESFGERLHQIGEKKNT